MIKVPSLNLVFKSKLNIVLSLFFIVGLFYVLVPGPSSIQDFSPVPDSIRSDLDGDTWQNPDLIAYFSDYTRGFLTQFYKDIYSKKFIFGYILPPVYLNHPPERAYQYIRDQQESTFLEEYTYPLRESFFINGYEPLVENQIYKKESNFIGNHVFFKNIPYNSKTTIRFYPSSVFSRVIVYLGIWIIIFSLYKITKKALRDV